MTNKQKKITALLVPLALIILSIGTCYGGVELLCAPGKNENLFMFILLFSGAVLITASLLFFASPAIFKSWFRFTKYYLPLAALAIIFSSPNDSSIADFDREFVDWTMAVIYLGISLILIIWKWIKFRNLDKKDSK